MAKTKKRDKLYSVEREQKLSIVAGELNQICTNRGDLGSLQVWGKSPNAIYEEWWNYKINSKSAFVFT